MSKKYKRKKREIDKCIFFSSLYKWKKQKTKFNHSKVNMEINGKKVK